jgi:hypothetical protein
MFFAHVILGNCTPAQANKEMTTPPLIPGQSIPYDSVTGVTKGTNVFMVYANKKTYPSYLITYLPEEKVIEPQVAKVA